ncbi:MAG: hypothetical protein RLZZ157_750 [Pseudomonadota bacterium]
MKKAFSACALRGLCPRAHPAFFIDLARYFRRSRHSRRASRINSLEETYAPEPTASFNMRAISGVSATLIFSTCAIGADLNSMFFE